MAFPSFPFTKNRPHGGVMLSVAIILSFLVSAVFARATPRSGSSYDSADMAKMSLSLMATVFVGQFLLSGSSEPESPMEVNKDKTKTFREDRGLSKLVPLLPQTNKTKTEPLPKYTSEQVSKKTTKDELWIIVNGRVYDVTKFVDRHPGGHFVMMAMGGKDCTDAFENYHQARITKAMLPAFLIGECVDVPVYPHVTDFREIRQELLRRGLFETDRKYYMKMYTWYACIFATMLYLSLICTSTTAHMFGAVCLGFFWQQIAGLGHDLGHSSVHHNFQYDHLVGSSIGCALMGISTGWWKRSHNTHHVVCNSVEHDPDIQHLPIIAQSDKIIEKTYWSSYHEKTFQMDAISRFLISYQHLVFVPLMLVARFNLYAQSWIMLFTTEYKMYNRAWEFAALSTFLTWVLSIALSMPTWTEGVAWVMLAHAVAGVLHFQIIISHWSSETYHGNAYNDESDEWHKMQLRTTLNVDCPAWFDWFHIGLQFQVEHHLFPMLPRHNLRIARTMVKEVCKKHGIVYHEMTFFEAIWSNIQSLRETAAKARAGEKVSAEMLTDILNAQG